VAVIAPLQVLQSSSVASTGETLLRLEQEKVSRTAQVHQLEAEVAALSALDRVERAARDRLGMTPARRIEYITVKTAPPSGPLLPRPVLGAELAAAPDGAPWWQSLLRALPFR